MSNSPTLINALVAALKDAAKVNNSVQARPATVLWTDAAAQWTPVLTMLRAEGLSIVKLGTYEPDEHQGPAIWLKCAVAGLIPAMGSDNRPSVLYLPGVSRSDLRAIETCPRDLQPLAELQYRGTFWSQANAKDWTISAFLTSKNGGLGLDVAQDKATQEALGQTLQAGVLLSQSLAELKGRSINAEWLLSLLAPNPARDVLQWMNEPEASRLQWGPVLWDVFSKRCRTDFGFDPVADGVLAAAERLAKAGGKWSAIAELYRDSFASFPQIVGLLDKVKPPQLGLFPEPAVLAGYPQANEQGESALRYSLAACAGMDAPQARAAVISAEKEHGLRRNWLWARMGRSPLASALSALAELSERSANAPIGQTPAELAASYQGTGWQVDAAAVRAMAAVHHKADIEAVGAALRAVYLPWVEEAARRLQEAAKATGGLPPLMSSLVKAPSSGVCTVFVDGLRYDTAMQLQERLSVLGPIDLAAQWTSLPSVTASGKAWCSPVAYHIAGALDDVEFEPRVAADGKPLSSYNFRKLLKDQGIQPLDKHETGDPQGQAWTEAGDFDHYGHEHGIRLARDLKTQLDQVVERVVELSEAGWKHIRIVTDHGWLLMPGGLPKSELPKHQAETRWGRCAVLKDSAHGTPLTFGWDWCKGVQVAYAPGVSCFTSGVEYAHGGISLQECLVPLLQLECSRSNQPSSLVAIDSLAWKGLRCTITTQSVESGYTVDIRTKAALASSSLVREAKPLANGKASLAIEDDDLMGAAAVLVILGSGGEVLQKQPTTIGG